MKKITTILIAFIALASCSDFLNVEPDLQVSFNEQLSTEDGVRQIMSGIYRDTEAISSSIFQVYPDYIGGNVAFAPRVSNRVLEIDNSVDTSYPFQETSTESDYSSFYVNTYDIINEVNLLLENLDDIDFLSNSQKNQMRAELLAVRVYAHYSLTLLFAQNDGFTNDGSHLGIIYNTNTLAVGTEFPSRDTVAQNYLDMQSDLETAISLFTSDSFLQVGPDYSYFNEWNTKGLYSRIALQMNDWQTAADLSDEIILQSGVALTVNSNYINEWLDTAPLSEVLMQFTAPVNSDGNTSSSISFYYQFTNSTNYGRFSVSDDLIDLFEPMDLRNQLYTVESIPTLTDAGILAQDYQFLNKYQEDSGTLNMRLTEMYLIYAEAQERLTPGNTLALDRLNDVRERAGIARLIAPSDMLEEVFQERRRELAFENSLFYDIARYKKDIIRDQGCIAPVCDLSYPSNFYVLPIPQSSILNNENMVQNDGY